MNLGLVARGILLLTDRSIDMILGYALGPFIFVVAIICGGDG